METLLQAQKDAINALNKHITNFGKAGQRKADKNFLARRLTELSTWWANFETRDTELSAFNELASQPYFTEKTFDKAKALYMNHRETVYKIYESVPGLVNATGGVDSENSGDDNDDDSVSGKDYSETQVTANAGFISLKHQLDDLNEIYGMIRELPSTTTMGAISAQLDILKSAWGDFRSKFSKERDNSNEQIVHIDFKTAQAKYASCYGQLNDLKTEKASKADGGRLAKIKLREFSGKIADWPIFIAMFDELVHDTDMKPAEKITQLKTHLTGEAERIVGHIAPSPENYTACYTILRNRYDNKRAMLSHMLDAIFAIPKQKYETSKNLESLYDTVNECVSSIKAIPLNISGWDPILNHVIMNKLSSETIKNYECQLTNVKELQKYGELMKYLESRFLALKSAESKNICVTDTKFVQSNNPKKQQNDKNCIYCKSKHATMDCKQLLHLPVNERWSWVNKSKLCINCLSNSHDIKTCVSKYSCRVCRGRHHSILHMVQKPIATSANLAVTGDVVLATALVYARNTKNNEQILLRVLLDQGSQSNFITEYACQALSLRKKRASITIFGIGGAPKTSQSLTSLELFSKQNNNFSLKINAIVLTRLTNLQHVAKQMSSFSHFQNIALADPSNNVSNKIDILLGAADFAKILKPGLLRGDVDEPIAQNTEFGWVVSGIVNQSKPKSVVVHVSTLDEQLNRIFETNDIEDDSESSDTEEQKFCEEHYVNTHYRDDNGKYVIKMPFKDNAEPVLGDSRKKAIATFFQLEKKFQKNEALRVEYTKFIHEYIAMNHMQISNDDAFGYYLPHHAVFKQSTTTKLRVVFNASQVSTNGKSLNEQLAIGKTKQRDILAIMIAWRFNKYACTSDIEKMYRQIWVHPSQRKFQKIIWRDSPDQPLREYCLLTVTYGMANAPYVAIRTLFQLANDSQEKFPAIAELIRDNFFMDDNMFGDDSFEELYDSYDGIRKVMRSGGFNLRKWSTNCNELREIIPENDLETPLNSDDNFVKTLGVLWQTNTDTLYLNVEQNSSDNIRTKRQLLSQISTLYDPMGWLAPVILQAKMIMQSVWLLNIGWDEKVPIEIVNEWLKIKTQLNDIKRFGIPRWVNSTKKSVIELHAFCDASQKGMAAVAYVRTINEGKIDVSLLMAKYRVAPIKSLTIPKLELSAAHLLSKVVKKILLSTKFKFSRVCLYSDARVALDWINGNPNRWKVFVKNKVNRINKNVEKENWHHVSTKCNPADCASRGLLPNELLKHSMWWFGPEFLHKNDVIIPTDDYTTIQDDGSNERVVEALLCNVQANTLPQATTFAELKRKVASKSQSDEALTVRDLEQAELEILQTIQQEIFGEEINCLKKGKNISKSSRLISLGVFLDDNNIIRVGGRLRNAELDYDAKHQILLPSNHAVSTLIVKEAHENCIHGGPRLTEAVLREKFWLINSQCNIKKVINHCQQCVVCRGRTLTQKMADLPAVRVTKTTRAFINCMVDYAGPIQIKTSTLKAAKIVKAYIAIFVCMVVKAVHIEPVSDMTSEAFIAALRRMTARRGRPVQIFCDNGTNFVGASREIVDMSKEEEEKVTFELTNMKISFRFSPAGSPHFNGLVEAAVKSVKLHLKRSIGEVKLTFEELATTLYQIEAAVNSRPLCALSNDAHEKSALTPAHFLIGTSMAAIPEEDVLEANINWLTRWKLVQRIVQNFWNRWQQEYLHTLQQRTKWRNTQDEPSEGDLVLIKDENLPSTKWPIATIKTKYPGSDGSTRVVAVETENGSLLKRAITKIVRLPKSTEVNLTQIRKKSSKKSSKKSHMAPILTAMCMVAMMMPHANAAPTNDYNVTVFQKPPVVLFKMEATAYISNSEWNIFAYFNLFRFLGEINQVHLNINKLNETCKTQIQRASRCSQVIRRLNLDYQDIRNKSEAFLTRTTRSKRAILNIVGNIASDLFGVLDSRFEEKYKDDLSGIHANEEHLMVLLKKQASVVETALNVVKKDEDEIARQHSFLNELVHNIGKSQNETDYFQQFFMTALQMTDECNRLGLLISQLLESVSNLDLKHINLNIISNLEVKGQIELIQKNIEKSLMVPDKNLYSVMKMKPYLTKKNIIFKITLPLLSVNKFQIFSAIPVPFKFGKNYIAAINISPYILTSIDFKRYELLGHREFSQCQEFDENIVICHGPNHLKSDRVDSCEWNTLVNAQISDVCEFHQEKISEKFIEFDTNKYIYICPTPVTATAMCGRNIFRISLGGEGTLSLNDDCVVDTGKTTITARRIKQTKFELSEISSNILVVEVGAPIIPKVVPSLSDFKETDFESMKSEVKHIRESELIDINRHDVHHYTVIYVILTIVIIAGIYAIYFRKQINMTLGKVLATPLNRAISMPTLSAGRENVQHTGTNN